MSMALLKELFGDGYTDPRLEMDSADATTANVLSRIKEMGPGAIEQFLSTPQGQAISIAVGLIGGRAPIPRAAGVRSIPLQARTAGAVKSEAVFARPRTEAEVGDQLPLPLGDTNRYPAAFAPRAAGEPVPPEVPAANLAAAQEAADAIRKLGPQYEPVVQPKGDSVYLRVMSKDPANPEAVPSDMGFKGRFADHAQLKWASISADPASGNTAADVVRAFRHQAGIDPTPPEVGWSKMDRNGKNGIAKQRGGIGTYEADFRDQGLTSPIRKTVRLFDLAPAAAAGGTAASDVSTEDIARLMRNLMGVGQ